MNRHQRRSLARVVAGSFRAERSDLEHPLPDSYRLDGGPMDGWVVKPDAPALAPDWSTTWIPSNAARFAPGRYVIVDADRGPLRRARWQPV